MSELSRDWSRHALDAEARERQKRLETVALEVFGDLNPDGAWILRQSSEFGDWQSPCEVAASNEEGLKLVLARLEELRETVKPQWRPLFNGRKGRRRK